jgi:hypothetical protein
MSVPTRSIPPATALALVLAALAPAPARSAPQPFDAPHTFSVGAGVSDPRSLVAADLDGDGRLDLVAGDRNGNDARVTVLRNTGGGSFGPPLGGPVDPGVTGTGAGAIAAGDLNGDGHPDVLAALETGTGAHDQLVLLAGDGTGHLSVPGAPITTRTDVSGVALADLDGDGALDALTSHRTATTTDQLAVLPGSGGGVLALDTSYGAGTTTLATGLATAQLDGTGGPDALVISAGPSGGTAWVATGAGALSTTLSAAAVPVPVGSDPVAVVVADVDGDGDQDGLVLDGTDPTLTLLRNDGAGLLTPATIAVPGLGQGSGLATGDLDGDGAADVVVTDAPGSRAGVLTGNGEGGFAAPQWLPMGLAARAPVVADLTGDGVADLATADAFGDTISVRRGTGVPAAHGAVAGAFGAQPVTSTGEAHTITVTNTGQARLAVAAVATTGAAADDFLVTGDDCTGATVAAGGTDACIVRVRFAPSAQGTRTAALRLRSAGGATLLDVALTGTGTTGAPATATTDPTTTTSSTAATPAPATPAATTPARVPTPPAKAKPKPKRLVLTLSRTKLAAAPGARVRVGYALGRAAKLVLRVKHAGRTVDIVRVAGREGRGTLTWDGRLGRTAAPAGTYRLDVFAVAADGHAARASTTLVLHR